ncbi:MAG: amidohydrolase [Bacteroidales bacterium]|jgi:5-methylthioadenosine/S-adenosylhomocysteine deaminase|nr:amidohydrolase [Bacteroidales bacterium]MDD4057660.1 amidohydrolase [Bacteroidales bacterium]
MSSILIKKATLEGIETDILIKDKRIEKIATEIDFIADKVINAKGKWVVPGFVNMHTHAAMTLMRGIGEDMHLIDWLENRIWPVEKKLDDEMVYWGSKLAALEMVKTGTTTFNDQYWKVPSSVKAIEEAGLRSVQPFVILDQMNTSLSSQIKNDCEELFQLSKGWSDLHTFAIGIHSPYSVTAEMIKWGSNFARERGLIVHIHLSETEWENNESLKKHGVSPTKYLEQLGVLGPEVVAAHSLWLNDNDIEILSKYDVKVVHNINSNLKIASGYKFRYNEMRDAGLTVTLGTDGCASSNNLDMLEAMKTAALVQKAWRGDPTSLPISELMNLATLNGGKSLGIKTGLIKEGWLADISLIDIDNYAFTPNINFLANLIYSANSSCIDTVICNGKVVMEGRKVLGEGEILENVNRLYKKLL